MNPSINFSYFQNLEIPVVSYCKHDNYMEFDFNIQSEASGEYTLKAIKDFSPFNEYFLGEKLGLFGEAGEYWCYQNLGLLC